ncbi:unnamed protein product [Bursaphelenchus xylophilus]|uniref:(pine wood nematode) hypothetical protein n=1 Tax=Bursaphelenchus xylophilus TaxID=6326 RepID=A0A1I7RZ86_BURXY|nr:unnamed protein product [Bursaphelenchus xylophilus]CAG9106742.1 unnamed protein product [Bursaphelenchus xylophilus]
MLNLSRLSLRSIPKRSFASSSGDKPSGQKQPSQLDLEKNDSQGQSWLSRILTGPAMNPSGFHKQSHSSLLAVSDAVFEIQTHDATSGNKEGYLKAYKNYSQEVQSTNAGLKLIGSFQVVYGNQDQFVHLWRYAKGWSDVDQQIRAISTGPLQTVDSDVAKLCTRRRNVLVKPFSYWGEPKEREPSHIYDMRTYVLKPGTMIEWGNAWAKGITYRREHNQDVGGFFAQVGQLYMVFHFWAYKDMVHRNHTRQDTWAKPGWDINVQYTVPLIKKMNSKILVPTPLSKLQ